MKRPEVRDGEIQHNEFISVSVGTLLFQEEINPIDHEVEASWYAKVVAAELEDEE